MVFSILKNSLTGHTGPPHFINFHALSLCVCVCVCVCARVCDGKNRQAEKAYSYIFDLSLSFSVFHCKSVLLERRSLNAEDDS